MTFCPCDSVCHSFLFPIPSQETRFVLRAEIQQVVAILKSWLWLQATGSIKRPVTPQHCFSFCFIILLPVSLVQALFARLPHICLSVSFPNTSFLSPHFTLKICEFNVWKVVHCLLLQVWNLTVLNWYAAKLWALCWPLNPRA